MGNMDKSKIIRQRLGLTIIITVGATYIITTLVVGILMNITTISLPMAQGIRLVIAGVIGFAVWNILKKQEQTKDNQKNPNQSSEPTLKTPGDSVDV